MSGIAGLWRQNQKKPAGSISIRAMLDQVSVRGPDGQDTRQIDGVAFAHAHLHSTPQSESETLPLLDSNSKCLITADSRLDDRAELIQALKLDISTPLQIGDGQLILHAYYKWGSNCAKHLKGDFAFAIWDPQAQTIFAARDHLGVKPFTYYSSSQLFAFASQSKAVTACRGVPRTVNENHIASVFVHSLDGLDHSSTFFKQIQRLPPAHSITVTLQGISIQRYWQLEVPAELQLASDNEYEEAFQKVFARAVERRLQGDHKTGAMLSGGIDSASIVAVGREIRNNTRASPLKTFSALASSEQEDWEGEAKCIQSIISQGSSHAHIVYPEHYATSVLSYQNAAKSADSPDDNCMHMTLAVFQTASENGVKSMMTGLCGDLTTSVSARVILYLIKDWKFAEALRETQCTAYLYDNYHYALSVLATCLPPALLPKRLWYYLRKYKRSKMQSYHIRTSKIRSDFAKQNHIREKLGDVYDIDLPETEFTTINGRQAHLITAPFVTIALERYDNLAGKCGIECSHPFFDLDVVNFCLSLPWKQKRRRGWEKWILRQSIGDLLPPDIKWRMTSFNFTSPFTQAGEKVRRSHLSASSLKSLKQTLNQYVDDPNPSDYTLFLASWLQQHESNDL